MSSVQVRFVQTERTRERNLHSPVTYVLVISSLAVVRNRNSSEQIASGLPCHLSRWPSWNVLRRLIKQSCQLMVAVQKCSYHQTRKWFSYLEPDHISTFFDVSLKSPVKTPVTSENSCVRLCDYTALFSRESRASTSWASVSPVRPLPCPLEVYRIAHSHPQHHISPLKLTPTLLRRLPRTIHSLVRHKMDCLNVLQTPLKTPPGTITSLDYNALLYHVVIQLCWPTFWPRP